jgi:tRNA(Ile)-lysidine synthetase-like protein
LYNLLRFVNYEGNTGGYIDIFFEINADNQTLLQEFAVDPPGVVAAVSGGIDSMMLLEYLIFLKNSRFIREILVFHANYQLRGLESDEDESFVRAYCERVNLQFIAERYKYCQESSGNLQSWARKIRYRKLGEISSELPGKSVIATGHHLDDLLETYFKKISEGTPLLALPDCLVRFGHQMWRPFLNVTKQQLKCSLDRKKLTYRHDSSNDSLKYERNRLRVRLNEHWTKWKTTCEKKRELNSTLLRCVESLRIRLEQIPVETKEGAFAVPYRSLNRLSPLMRKIFLENLLVNATNTLERDTHSSMVHRGQRNIKNPSTFAKEVLKSCKDNVPFLAQISENILVRYTPKTSLVDITRRPSHFLRVRQHPLFRSRLKRFQNLKIDRQVTSGL